MAAKKNKRKTAGGSSVATMKPPSPASSSSQADERRGESKMGREAVESIVVAILLALLFRGFEAEAFIIPTGSMAPTLQGRHKDVRCPQCDYQYRAGAAQETGMTPMGAVVETNCPMCRFGLHLDPDYPNHGSFSGDRILVNKYVYQFSDPKRWDVIVFKYPGNAKQNYIKRLVGLPNETLRVTAGDVYARPQGAAEFEILRKPPSKLPYIMHPVYDTQHVAPALVSVNWPARWQDRDPGSSLGWKSSDDRRNYSLAASDDVRWLGYRHFPPTDDDWAEILRGKLPASAQQRTGGLITDHYAYNAYRHRQDQQDRITRYGWHWVGDLAAEAIVKIDQVADNGVLSLRLVEGGLDFVWEIDPSSGEAKVTIEGGQLAFTAVDGNSSPRELIANTPVKGPGTYRLMWANVDDHLLLWVNRKLIQFQAAGQEHPGYFTSPAQQSPQWSPADSGDQTPVAIGARGLALQTNRLRVLRDVYYVAAKSTEHSPWDYRGIVIRPAEVQQILETPKKWAEESRLFASRRAVEFELGEDQFFPMGDNSPASKDARLWGGPNDSLYSDQKIWVDSYVERELLIGKAFLVYWPHTWNPGRIRLPILPNLDRMGRIR